MIHKKLKEKTNEFYCFPFSISAIASHVFLEIHEDFHYTRCDMSFFCKKININLCFLTTAKMQSSNTHRMKMVYNSHPEVGIGSFFYENSIVFA